MLVTIHGALQFTDSQAVNCNKYFALSADKAFKMPENVLY